MLRINVKFSPALMALSLGLYVTAILIMLNTVMPLIAKAISVFSILAGLVWIIGRYVVTFFLSSITHIWWRQNNEWLLLSKAGNLFPAELMGNSFISKFLIILNFKVNNKRVSTLLPYDIFSKTDYRRLRVLLQCIDTKRKNC